MIFRWISEKAIMINDNSAHINQPLRWTTIVSDFESGFLPAIQAALPLVNQRGCHTHHDAAIFRQIQRSGLSIQYKRNPAVKKFCKIIFALAFLPPDEIEHVLFLIRALFL